MSSCKLSSYSKGSLIALKPHRSYSSPAPAHPTTGEELQVKNFVRRSPDRLQMAELSLAATSRLSGTMLGISSQRSQQQPTD
jgi:hypothetical protein